MLKNVLIYSYVRIFDAMRYIFLKYRLIQGYKDVDEASSCTEWANKGYCESGNSYHSYMWINCIHTCQMDKGEGKIILD